MQFNPTLYLSIVKENNVFVDDPSIVEFAQTNLNFNYGNIIYEKFSEKDSSELRSDINGLTCLINTITHLTKIVYIGLADLIFSQNSELLKLYTFYVLQDFQAFIGIIASLT